MIAPAMAWYKEWFGEEYLDLYAHRDRAEAERHAERVESLLDAASHPPRAVLDLACGAGRHTEALRGRGYRTLGIDLSLTLLAQRPDLPRVAGDMRRLPFADRSFDWVLNFFTSFGYFEEERENFRVLEEVVRVLDGGGRFLIDLMNPEPVIESLRPRESTSRDGRQVDVERWFDPASRRINKRIRIRRGDDPEHTYLESVRAYTRDEVVIGLQWAGLQVLATYGNFEGESFQRDSERLIIVATKP
jgi:SAM-dependent methyltransferase